MRAAAIAIGVVLAGCALDHRSDELACTSPTECTGGRSCVDGYCVMAPVQCPGSCDGCVIATMTCMLDGDAAPNGNVTCPAGWNCAITCGADACRTVDCRDGQSCTVECNGDNACDTVRCGSGPCDVTCSGQDACNSVDCRDSCGCDVTCADAQSCSNPAQCPGNPCQSGDGCSSAPTACDHC